MYFGHIAIYTGDMEAMKDFYCRYFNGKVFFDSVHGDQHRVYIAFDQECYLELMDRASIPPSLCRPGEEREGLTHIAINAESTGKVDELTARLEKDGYTLTIALTEPDASGNYEISEWKITKQWNEDDPLNNIWKGE